MQKKEWTILKKDWKLTKHEKWKMFWKSNNKEKLRNIEKMGRKGREIKKTWKKKKRKLKENAEKKRKQKQERKTTTNEEQGRKIKKHE